MAEARVNEECPAGCCPHHGVSQDGDCPSDLPQAPMLERIAHLYACQMLSTYKIAKATGVDRQRVASLLHKAGVIVTPRGAGRHKVRRNAEDERLDELMAHLYLTERLPSTQIAELTGMRDHTVLARLRAKGVPIRTRGRFNREDRAAVSPDELAALYLRAGLSADEAGKLLGVSRRIVLRSAHDQGLPVRVGGAPPTRGPSEIELITALYSDPQVHDTLERHGVPVVAQGGPIWRRFPAPHRLTEALVLDLYEDCGLSLHHIELLTGRPAAAAGVLLRASGTGLRPPGGRSPFMRRWREG
jgi:hypothetical protein